MSPTRLFIVVFLSFCIFIAAVATQEKGGVTKDSTTAGELKVEFNGKVEQEIEALELRLCNAVARRDRVTLNELYSDSLLVNDDLLRNVTSEGKRDYIASLTVWVGRTGEATCEKSQLRIRVYGDTAVVKGRQIINRTIFRVDAPRSTTSFLNVWRKEKDGKWRCVASS